jgi:lathosterol oxidase
MKEIARSIRGVAVGSAWEYGISRFRSYEIFPLYYPSFLYPDLGFGQSSGTMLTIAGLLLYLLGDFHFYWTHRMLHSRILHKLVHKYHHESFYSTPFSGLSMHWLESFIYFSYVPVLGTDHGSPIKLDVSFL